MRLLTAIPVYNEAASLVSVLTEVKKYASDVLVVDDGSTDRTPELLREISGRAHDPPSRAIWDMARACARPSRRRSRKATTASSRSTATASTSPHASPSWPLGLAEADIVSGSRYLKVFDPDPAAAGRAPANQSGSDALAQ